MIITTKDLSMEILMWALSNGCIPVLIHDEVFDSARPEFLPLSETVDWSLASIVTASWNLNVSLIGTAGGTAKTC